jgi:hypothetical protein
MMRLVLLLICIIGIFLVPWWVMLVVLLIAVFFYRRYFQALIPAVLIDVMHGGASLVQAPFASVTVWISIALILLMYVELYLRDNVRI